MASSTRVRRESIEEKGWRIFATGGVWRNTWGSWCVRGDSGEVYVDNGGGCPCPARGACSHQVAVAHADAKLEAPEGTVEVPAAVLAAWMRIELETDTAETEGRLRRAWRGLKEARSALTSSGKRVA
ncbi:MAG: hypothetical protein M3P49_10320 [Actinomycetota bacterium]|nr:hypothetical protein [Actinomycetota bacterium]